MPYSGISRLSILIASTFLLILLVLHGEQTSQLTVTGSEFVVIMFRGGNSSYRVYINLLLRSCRRSSSQLGFNEPTVATV
jgi:hypothetical protein